MIIFQWDHITGLLVYLMTLEGEQCFVNFTIFPHPGKNTCPCYHGTFPKRSQIGGEFRCN